jgi:hypothetical protein
MPPLGTGILCRSCYSNCKVVNDSLGYKISIVRLKEGLNGVRETHIFYVVYVAESTSYCMYQT